MGRERRMRKSGATRRLSSEIGELRPNRQIQIGNGGDLADLRRDARSRGKRLTLPPETQGYRRTLENGATPLPESRFECRITVGLFNLIRARAKLAGQKAKPLLSRNFAFARHTFA